MWWCIDIANGWAHISRQIKYWVDGEPRFWDEETKEIAPDVHHAWRFGELYYVRAETCKGAKQKLRNAKAKGEDQ